MYFKLHGWQNQIFLIKQFYWNKKKMVNIVYSRICVASIFHWLHLRLLIEFKHNILSTNNLRTETELFLLLSLCKCYFFVLPSIMMFVIYSSREKQTIIKKKKKHIWNSLRLSAFLIHKSEQISNWESNFKTTLVSNLTLALICFPFKDYFATADVSLCPNVHIQVHSLSDFWH